MKKIVFLLFAFISLAAVAQNKQVKVSLRNGTAIEGEVKEFDALDHITIIVGGVETTIPMSQVSYVSNIGEQTQRATESVAETTRSTEVITEDPLKDFKGFLLAKGNNVYVYSEDGEFGKAGADELKRLLKADGFWNVVDYMNEAHFVITYLVHLRHRDRVTISVSSWRTNNTKLIYSNTSNGLETTHVNREMAQSGYYDGIKSLQKKIEKMNGKAPSGDFKNFILK